MNNNFVKFFWLMILKHFFAWHIYGHQQLSSKCCDLWPVSPVKLNRDCLNISSTKLILHFKFIKESTWLNMTNKKVPIFSSRTVEVTIPRPTFTRYVCWKPINKKPLPKNSVKLTFLFSTWQPWHLKRCPIAKIIKL